MLSDAVWPSGGDPDPNRGCLSRMKALPPRRKRVPEAHHQDDREYVETDHQKAQQGSLGDP